MERPADPRSGIKKGRGSEHRYICYAYTEEKKRKGTLPALPRPEPSNRRPIRHSSPRFKKALRETSPQAESSNPEEKQAAKPRRAGPGCKYSTTMGLCVPSYKSFGVHLLVASIVPGDRLTP